MNELLPHVIHRTPRSSDASPLFLSEGGQMGELTRAFDWTATPLGPPSQWPIPLRTSLRTLLTTNHPCCIFWGETFTCFYNDAYARSIGPEQHPRILGMAGHEAWNDLWPIIAPQIAIVMAGDGSTWHEKQRVPMMRAGRIEDVFWTYSYGPIHDEAAPNSVGGVMVLCTENTAQLDYEARLRADATRWRSLFQHSPGFLCVVRGVDHRIEYCNPRFCALVGRNDVPAGNTFAADLPELVEQGYIAILDEALRSGQSRAAVADRVVIAGQQRFVDYVCEPVHDEDGIVSGLLVQGFDVTERELAKSRLMESESRLRLATNAAQLGIHEYDVRSGGIRWDERVRNLWGASPDEEITHELFLRGVVEEDREEVIVAFNRALSVGGGGVYEAEYRVRSADGILRWVRATGQVEFSNERPVRLIGTVQDISRQKVAEAELIEADRRKDVFLATLAHELRNPLAPIRNAAQILATAGIGSREVAWAQQVISRQSSHMASLLDDLLDIARLTQGRFELNRSVVEMRSIIDSAAETVMPQLDAAGHVLDIRVPFAGLSFFGDALRLCQVFSTLLANATKNMNSCGTIVISSVLSADAVTVSVTDSGKGMSRSALTDAFGMFRQSEASLERAEGGLGIGLAIVRAIVELHGGTVDVASDGVGKGSTFTVTLPIEPMSADDGRDPTSAVFNGHVDVKRIVIADDNGDATYPAERPGLPLLVQELAK